MAEISDLTTEQQTTLLAVDFNTLYYRLLKVLDKYVPKDDRDKAEADDVISQLKAYEEIILASGNTAAVTADAIINP